MTYAVGSHGTQSELDLPIAPDQRILPVTIRSVENALELRADATSMPSFFNAIEPSSLQVVAIVESVTSMHVSIELLLNDSTGRIQCRYYVTASQSVDLSGVQIGRYIQVVGMVRLTPVIHLSASHIHLVQSADQVSYHRIECAHAALQLLSVGRGRIGAPRTTIQSSTTSRVLSAPFSAENAMQVVQECQVERRHQAVWSPLPEAHAMPVIKSYDESLEAVVIEEFRKHRDTGVSIERILEAMDRAGAISTMSHLRLRLEDMVANGVVYNTIDVDHFAPVWTPHYAN